MPGNLVLKAEARRLGFSNCGVAPASSAVHWDFYRQWLDEGFGASMAYLEQQAELKRTSESVLPGVRSVIAVTLNYNQPFEHAVGAAKIARYAQGRDYHKVIRGRLRRLAEWVEANHSNAVCRPCVDSAPIFEREYAHLAGLGWFGKNTMLIDSRAGSWFFLGLLLTTAELEADLPSDGGCGTCQRCIEACPTGAIVHQNGRWQVDSRRCISYLTIEHKGVFTPEQRESVGDWTFGCDVCQEVCPFNQPRASQPDRAPVTQVEDFRRRTWPDLAGLANLPRDEWDELTQGSAIRRTGLDGLRRNAQANLANQPQ